MQLPVIDEQRWVLQGELMSHVVVALVVEAVGLFSIAGAITLWTRSVLRAV